MNKQEFLKELTALLADLPPDERASALEYYTEYLDEAGPEREAEVLQELGSPENVAKEIHGEGWTPPAKPEAAAQGAQARANPEGSAAAFGMGAAPKAPTPPPPPGAGTGGTQRQTAPPRLRPAARYT